MKKIILITIIATISSFANQVNYNNVINKIKSKSCKVKISYKNLQYPNSVRTKIFNPKNRFYSSNTILANSNTYKFLIEFDGKKIEYTATKGEKSWTI